MPNIDDLSSTELRALQEKCAALLKERAQEDKKNALTQIHAIAESVGIPALQLVREEPKTTAPRIRKTVTPKYQHPTDSSIRWSGRGMPPKWFKAWQSEGKDTNELLIPAA